MPSAECSCQHIGSSGSGRGGGLVAGRAGAAAMCSVRTKFSDSDFLLRPPGERYGFTGMYDVASPPIALSLTVPLSPSQAMQICTTPLKMLLIFSEMFSFLKPFSFVQKYYSWFILNDTIKIKTEYL